MDSHIFLASIDLETGIIFRDFVRRLKDKVATFSFIDVLWHIKMVFQNYFLLRLWFVVFCQQPIQWNTFRWHYNQHFHWARSYMHLVSFLRFHVWNNLHYPGKIHWRNQIPYEWASSFDYKSPNAIFQLQKYATLYF